MKKIRYGVIGIKGIGKYHVDLAQHQPRVELAALADIDAAFVNQKSKELGVRGFTDYRDMLDAGIVDAVSIALPHHLHREVGLTCLKAGLHIFIEKPLANRVSEAEAMIASAQAKNLKICVGHQYRTHRSSRVLKELIESGAIGKIMRVLWSWVEFRPESYYTRDIWRTTWQYSGGGILMNQVSHDLDLLCWLAGKPVQVSALVANQLHAAEIEDIACANILFANGALASFQATINQPRGYSVRQIAGDKGVIVMQDVKSLTSDQDDQILLGTYEDALLTKAENLAGDHDQPGISWQFCKLPNSSRNDQTIVKKLARRFDKMILSRLTRSETVLQRAEWLKLSEPVGHYALMNSFIQAILWDKEPLVSGESALPVIELINAILLSAIRKKTVDLPLDRAEYDHLFEELCSGKVQTPRFRCNDGSHC